MFRRLERIYSQSLRKWNGKIHWHKIEWEVGFFYLGFDLQMYRFSAFLSKCYTFNSTWTTVPNLMITFHHRKCLRMNIGNEYIFTQPVYHKQFVTQCPFLSRVKLVWIQISGYLTKDKEHYLPYIYYIVWRRMMDSRNFLYKNITLRILFLERVEDAVSMRQTEIRGCGQRLLYWPLPSS